ncbi:KAP family P-loop NTPase fold protein [Vibrio alginolyticus]|uniref:KAP family P-loop NTPase fold protein n=1 Tax=Vibrio alginolyticus TaxID=663 RepID=UPI00384E29B7
MNTATAPTQAFADCAYKEVREKQASAFTKYLDSRPSHSSYVANLNGAWGTGKTFFVNNWADWLSEKGYVAIKIDAWESDYLNDPLAIVTAEMLSQLKDHGGITDFAEQEKQIINYGWKLAKNFLPVLTMALGRHFLGAEYESLLKEVGLSVKDSANDKSESAPDFGAFGKKIFETHDKHKEFVKGFKTNLDDLIKIVFGRTGNKKVYVFVDELDRCRPTYAIEMLEVVKHLFDIPNLVFVLSTDTNQLECSIKAVYGEKFDSEEYLSRFFKRRLTLTKPDYLTFIHSIDAFSEIDFEPSKIYPAVCKETAKELFSILCTANNISFRRAELLCARVEAALVNLPTNTAVSFIELVGNIFCFELYPKLDTKYVYSYAARNHEIDGKTYTVHSVDDIGGQSIRNVFDEYQRLWRAITGLHEAILTDQRYRDIETSCNQNREKIVAQFIYFKKFKSFSNIAERHENAQTGFNSSYSWLIKNIIEGKVNILTDDALHEFLHCFDDFS